MREQMASGTLLRTACPRESCPCLHRVPPEFRPDCPNHPSSLTALGLIRAMVVSYQHVGVHPNCREIRSCYQTGNGRRSRSRFVPSVAVEFLTPTTEQTGDQHSCDIELRAAARAVGRGADKPLVL